jgi:predicted PurR-regulated permease PerM
MTEPRLDLTRTVIAVLFIALLIVAPFWVLKPFLGAIVWATVLAVATWPIMCRLQKWLWGKRSLAVTAMTLGLLGALVIPVAALVIGAVENVDEVKSFVANAPNYHIPPAPAWLGKLPLVGGKAEAMWTSAASAGVPALAAKVGPHVRGIASSFGAELGSVGAFFVQFLLTVAIQAVMFARGESAVAGVRAFARRVGGSSGEQVVDLAGGTIHAVAMGVVVTAAAQAVFAGLGLAIAHVPLAAALTLVIFVLCLAQLSPLLTFTPLVIWSFYAKGVGWGVFMIVLAIATDLLSDFLQPLLLKKGVKLPTLVTLSGVVGGLMSFGLIGLFVGPVLLAVTYTLLTAWVKRGSTDNGYVVMDTPS